MSDILESSLEEPPKKKRNLHTSSTHEEPLGEHSKPAKKPTKKPLRQQQMFAVLFSSLFYLNDKDGNHLIDQVWITFWRVALAPLPHMNNNSLL